MDHHEKDLSDWDLGRDLAVVVAVDLCFDQVYHEEEFRRKSIET
jgi:hypothetical protein